MKAPQKVKFFLDEDPDVVTERQERMEALKSKFPGGIAVIQPITERKEDPGFERVRPEDKERALMTHLPVDTWRRDGTHPATGLPNVKKEIVKIDLIDPIMKWPIDVRTDQIKKLDRRTIDKWELLEYLDEHPLNGIHFRLLPIDPVLDKKLKAALKEPRAKALLDEVIHNSQNAIKGKTAKRVGDVTKTEEVPEDEFVEA